MKKVRTYKIKSENQKEKCKPSPIEKKNTVELPLKIRVMYLGILGTYVKKDL